MPIDRKQQPRGLPHASKRYQQPATVIAGNKIYMKCGNCGRMVQINKFLFGSLHVCD